MGLNLELKDKSFEDYGPFGGVCCRGRWKGANSGAREINVVLRRPSFFRAGICGSDWPGRSRRARPDYGHQESPAPCRNSHQKLLRDGARIHPRPREMAAWSDELLHPVPTSEASSASRAALRDRAFHGEVIGDGDPSGPVVSAVGIGHVRANLVSPPSAARPGPNYLSGCAASPGQRPPLTGSVSAPAWCGWRPASHYVPGAGRGMSSYRIRATAPAGVTVCGSRYTSYRIGVRFGRRIDTRRSVRTSQRRHRASGPGHVLGRFVRRSR